MRRTLITGGCGQLAADLRQLIDGEVWSPGHRELDVTDRAALESSVKEFAPDWIFNCAAFHVFASCEDDPESAFSVNAASVQHLAVLAARTNARLVHFSTNYVFDGAIAPPFAYRPNHLASPSCIYGLSKLAGEMAIRAYCPEALIVRTAALYGKSGNASKGGSFPQRIVAKARANELIEVVSDQWTNPTSTPSLAAAAVELADSGASGIAHIVCGGAASWYEFARLVLELSGVDGQLRAISTPAGSPRPRNTVLEATVPMPRWDQELEDFLGQTGHS